MKKISSIILIMILILSISISVTAAGGTKYISITNEDYPRIAMLVPDMDVYQLELVYFTYNDNKYGVFALAKNTDTNIYTWTLPNLYSRSSKYTRDFLMIVSTSDSYIVNARYVGNYNTNGGTIGEHYGSSKPDEIQAILDYLNGETYNPLFTPYQEKPEFNPEEAEYNPNLPKWKLGLLKIAKSSEKIIVGIAEIFDDLWKEGSELEGFLFRTIFNKHDDSELYTSYQYVSKEEFDEYVQDKSVLKNTFIDFQRGATDSSIGGWIPRITKVDSNDNAPEYNIDETDIEDFDISISTVTYDADTQKYSYGPYTTIKDFNRQISNQQQIVTNEYVTENQETYYQVTNYYNQIVEDNQGNTIDNSTNYYYYTYTTNENITYGDLIEYGDYLLVSPSFGNNGFDWSKFKLVDIIMAITGFFTGFILIVPKLLELFRFIPLWAQSFIISGVILIVAIPIAALIIKNIAGRGGE